MSLSSELVAEMKMKYIKLLQNRTGELAIGRSTLRNQGAPKVIETARNYLKTMNLKPLNKVSSQNDYLKYLDKHTIKLSQTFPKGAKGNWGAARKAINIFIRDCLYNQYLSAEYNLNKLEKWLEVPLDNDVATNIRKKCKTLPTWKSIKSLTQDVSNQYQQCAQIIGNKEKVARVHLDIKYWRNGNQATNKRIQRTRKTRR